MRHSAVIATLSQLIEKHPAEEAAALLATLLTTVLLRCGDDAHQVFEDALATLGLATPEELEKSR